MEKSEGAGHDGGADHDDQNLSRELEDLYRRVADVSQPDAGGGQIFDLRNDSSTGTSNEGRSVDCPRCTPTQEEMMAQLMVIKEAYERILTYWPYAPERPANSTATENDPGMSESHE
jgi:hypothetical protein